MLAYEDFVIALLREEGAVSEEQLDAARRHAATHKLDIASALVELGHIDQRGLAMARAGVCESPFVDITQFDIDIANAAKLPKPVAVGFKTFPLFILEDSVTVGMVDPMNLEAVDRVRGYLRTDVETVLCEPAALEALIERAYSLGGGITEASEEAIDEGPVASDEPIVAAVNQILAEAVTAHASDIHIGPDERTLHLRYRIDGTLQHRQGPPLSSHAGIVQRLKVMADLDLTQNRRPQDGKFRFSHAGRSVDMRVSIIPTIWGENVVIRLLGGALNVSGFEELGCSREVARMLDDASKSPHGMVLVTGPTGSGKTTTLYTALSRINAPERNVVAIEDPVEYRLPMVRHVQVNPEIGLTFASALRAIMRQDPDVILLGEIRDEETARIAVQAALTGHLVLSTLHTNDAPGSIARLQNFNCPDFAINASLNCVLAQRLVRKVCEHCANPYTPDPSLMRRFMPPDQDGQFRRGSGCPRCSNLGMRGRVGIFECFRMSRRIQDAIESGASTGAIRALAIRDGMSPMWQDGIEKARMGLTTLEEIAAVAAGSIDDVTDEPAERMAA